jgi:hypothetical protein
MPQWHQWAQQPGAACALLQAERGDIQAAGHAEGLHTLHCKPGNVCTHCRPNQSKAKLVARRPVLVMRTPARHCPAMCGQPPCMATAGACNWSQWKQGGFSAPGGTHYGAHSLCPTSSTETALTAAPVAIHGTAQRSMTAVTTTTPAACPKGCNDTQRAAKPQPAAQ